MKEKELRLALVCYGGVSLAVYIHGVTKEIQKLVRASKIIHSLNESDPEADFSYDGLNGDTGRETDTERVYFELLKAIGKHIDLRVVVDIIAGASAGGINGVMLARSLAHDLPLDSHREMWLERSDITALLDEKAIAGKWSKAYLMPLLWEKTNRWLRRFAPDEETQEKLSLFLRSRWFKPPFSGQKLSSMLLDACASMDTQNDPTSSLLPMGLPLDLIVSVVDFYGYERKIPLHDPAVILEREHRHALRFHYLNHPGGAIDTEFDMAHAPGLVFAARASSSYPGAFPAAQVVEIDKVLKARGEEWPNRDTFLNAKFRPHIEAGSDPVTASFIDGAVLNNKPFDEAIRALKTRSAFREVDRRMVYIDPDPDAIDLDGAGRVPGFFQTIRGALSDIPRNEPVHDELVHITKMGEKVRLFNQVIEATRPQVIQLVEPILARTPNSSPAAEALALWRDEANTAAAIQAGYAYDGYIQIKVLSVIEQVTDLIDQLSGVIMHPHERQALTRSVEAWARQKEIFPIVMDLPQGVSGPGPDTPWVEFLRSFDLPFRQRRLRFVIRRLNELYEKTENTPDGAAESDALDEFKIMLYSALEQVTNRTHCSFFSAALGAFCSELLRDRKGELTVLEVNSIVERLSPLMALSALDDTLDVMFCAMLDEHIPERIRPDLLNAYVGFPFFDVLTFPLVKSQGLDEIDDVLVDRISPEDARAIRQGGAHSVLRGWELNKFGAFFSREARENDYLWGRLHGADRLVDIVLSAVPLATEELNIDVADLKRQLFQSILDAEAPHLPKSTGLIDTLRVEISTASQAPQHMDGSGPSL